LIPVSAFCFGKLKRGDIFILQFAILLLVSLTGKCQRLPLDTGWKLTEPTHNISVDAQVPGTVYGNLLKAGKVPDIRNGNSEKELLWLEDCTWKYEKSVDVSDTILQHEHVELVFEGLDTYAIVYVNDSIAIVAGNMFREWRADIKKWLHRGHNNLRLVIFPPRTFAIQMQQGNPYLLPQTDTSKKAISSFIRKAPYHFGWDFAPRLVDAGIIKPVYLEMWDEVVVRSFTIRTVEIKNATAHLDATVTLTSDRHQKKVKAVIGEKHFRFIMDEGTHDYHFNITVKDPDLWWPNRSGRQSLYEYGLKLTCGKEKCVEAKTRFGIRTVELIQDTDSLGAKFYFRVNGYPVFMQGANYVTPYQWASGISKRDLITAAQSSGMNMLRVWGGGIYEDNEFYALCDEMGILIWQDFMFADAMYPTTPVFLENVKEEVTQNVKRISGHPSLALWCGNNESDVAWKYWGWQQQYGYSSEDSTAISNGYAKLFRQEIPAVLAKVDPNTPYIHTSPLSNWGKRSNFNYHNMHYWGVWHGEESIDSFSVNVPRFMTEYGMQSYPSFRALSEVLKTDSLQMDSPDLTARQKSYKGNKLLFSYIADRYRQPSNLTDLCYLSQLNQADALEIAIRSHRKATGRCMGTLFWQLNDVWPGASWSVIESEGTPKAAFYKLHELYAPDLLIPELEAQWFNVYYQRNDTLKSLNVKLKVEVKDFYGNEVTSYLIEHILGAAQTQKLFTALQDKLIQDKNPSDVFVELTLMKSDSVLAKTICYFVKPKQLNLQHTNIQYVIGRQGEKTLVTLKSDLLAKGVYLQFKNAEGFFSDNYFDLLPGEEKQVTFEGMTAEGELQITTFLPEREPATTE